MAAEDDNPSATESPAAQRQKRPPVTIDLEAETVPPPADAEPQPAPPADEPSSGRPADPPASSARSLLPLAAAAIAGGVVGGIVAAFLFAPPNDTVTDASTDSRFATVASRLDALEAKVSQAPTAATPAIDPARIEALEKSVAALQTSPPAAAAVQAAPATDLAPIEQRLAALESRPVAEPAPTVDLAPLEQRLEQMAARVADIEANPPSDPATEAAARTIALTALRQAAASEKPFAPELDAVRTLGSDEPALAALAPFAGEATPSAAALQASFPDFAERMRVASTQVDPEAGILDRLGASASALVSVKPSGPVAGTSTTAIVSRMEAAVAKGDLSAALAESEALDAPAKSVLAPWAEAAKRRVAIDGALATLGSGPAAASK
jgi:hypothetical protein